MAETTSQDIYSTIMATLASYGIVIDDDPNASNLGSWLWQQLIDGASQDQILREIKETDEYKARFPAMAHFDETMQGMTEGGYIAREKQYRDALGALGLQYQGFGTTDYLASLMQNEVSVDELTDRVKYAQDYISQQAPRSVVDALRSEYGMTDIEMVEYMLDPDNDDLKISLEYQANRSRAEVLGAAADSGLGLSRGMVNELARSGVGYRQGVMGMQEAAQNADALRQLSALDGDSFTDDEIAATSSQFQTVGSVKAKEKKKKLASKERARFSKSSGLSGRSLTQGGLGSV